MRPIKAHTDIIIVIENQKTIGNLIGVISDTPNFLRSEAV